MTAPTNPPVLAYSVPRVLFQDRYQYRSGRSVFAFIVLGTASGGFGYFATSVIPPDQIGIVGITVFGLMSATCAVLACWIAWAWWAQHHVGVEINEDGIVQGRKFWAWSDIARVAWIKESGGVVPHFVSTGGLPIGRSLLLSRGLTRDEYQSLSLELTELLRKRHPKVVVDSDVTSSS